MNILAIIPARYASTRLPGKPLLDINGKSMIQRVYEQSKKVFEHVIVATDDERILTAVNNFGGNAIMTSVEHKSGTDRCAEALAIYEKESGLNFEFIINVQGDEPYIQPEQLQLLVDTIKKPDSQIATLVKAIENSEILFDPNIPKVVLNTKKEAVYFSRNTIPYLRNEESNNWLQKHVFYKHIGLYAYRKKTLSEITKLKPSKLEMAESLEQLRWIENGYKINVEVTGIESVSVDTRKDLKKLLKNINSVQAN